jgi:hypothetical protein
MNGIFDIKAVVISNFYNFTCETMVLKRTMVELEQGWPRGGLAHWAVNPFSLKIYIFLISSNLLPK